MTERDSSGGPAAVVPDSGRHPVSGGRRLTAWRYAVLRRLYRGGRAGKLARATNRLSAIQFSSGILTPRRAATLEVRGRRTGRVISFPVVVADHDGERYVVSMLGETSWVRNLRADNRAVLRRGRAERVRLVEVTPGLRAPILRRYLDLAPGARAHIPVDRRAPLAEIERVADGFPVFQVVHGWPTASSTDQTQGLRLP